MKNTELKKRNSSVLLLTVLMTASLSIGCGSQKTTSGSTSQGSRIGADGSQKVAECNRLNASFINTDMKTLYHNGEASFEFIYLKINSIDTQAFSGLNDYYVRFFSWEALDDENASISQDPLKFRIERKGFSGQGIPITGYYDTLSYTMLKEIIDEYNSNYPATAITGAGPNDWFSQIHFVVSGLTRYDDAIKIAGYGGSGNAVHEADALIPAFYSNPNTYETQVDPDGKKRSTILTGLHPFNSQKGTWSDQRFYDESTNYCLETSQ